MCLKKYIKLAQWWSWRRRRRRLVVIRQKRRRTCITTLGSHVHNHLVELFIIHRELLVFLSEISLVLFQGHDILRLGARYWFGAPNGWDTTSLPQVLGRSVDMLTFTDGITDGIILSVILTVNWSRHCTEIPVWIPR